MSSGREDECLVMVPEDTEYCIYFTVTSKERTLGYKLSKYAANRPDIDWGRVAGRAKQDLRGSVPQSDNLVSISPDWHTKGARQTKISELEDAFAVNQKVCKLQIPVQDATRVAISHTTKQLVHVTL